MKCFVTLRPIPSREEMFKRKKIKAKLGLTIQRNSRQTPVKASSFLSESVPAEPDIRARYQWEPESGSPGAHGTFLSGKKVSRL